MPPAIANLTPFTNGTTSSATLSGTVPSTTAGNTLIVALVYAESSGTPTVTSVVVGTNTLTSKYSLENGSGLNAFCNFFVLDNIASGQTTFTTTFTAAYFSCAWVYEVSGLLTSGSFDKATGGSGSTGKPSSSGLLSTLSTPHDFMIGLALGFTTGTLTVLNTTGGWTTEANQTCYTSSDINAVTSYQIAPSYAGEAYAISPSTSNYYVDTIAAFKPAAAYPGYPAVSPDGQDALTENAFFAGQGILASSVW
jgi:hypothetical protein